MPRGGGDPLGAGALPAIQRAADARRPCGVLFRATQEIAWIAGARKSGRVRAAHPATALRGALVLVQSTPGAVLLGTSDGVVQAVDPDGTARANGLSLALPDLTLWLT